MKKRIFTSEFKVKLVLEVLRGEHTVGEIAAQNEINPTQLNAWKREFMDKAPSLFDEPKKEREAKRATQEAEDEKARMLKTIGQLTMERDYLKAATAKLQERGLL
jgi:transposase-like protein